MLSEPLSSVRARDLIREIIKSSAGIVVFSRHAKEEMRKDTLDAVDVTNVLRCGHVDPGEFENGSWRYRVRTPRMAVIVAFRSETELRVVTAWRLTS